MTRTALLRWATVLGGALLCTALALLHAPSSGLLPFFFLALSAILLLGARDGALAALLCIAVSGALLYTVPPAHRPVPLVTIVVAEAWFAGTCLLVWLLALRLRRQVRALARAAENVLPQPNQTTGGLDGGHPGPQHLYARLLDSAPDGVVVVDEAGHVVFFSAQAEALFGYRREDVLGQPIEMLLPEALRERHRAHRAAYLAAPQTRPMGAGLELVARRKDGSEFPVEISLAPVDTEQGGRRAMLIKAALRDVAERKAMEARLQEAQIQREVAERAVQERDDFLSTAAHELKTPLTSLGGFAEILQRTLADAPGLDGIPVAQRRRIDKALATIVAQGEKTTRLVEQLLSMARLGAGRVALERRDTDMVALAQAAVTQARMRAEGHEIALDTPRPVDAAVDPLRIDQVFTNLLDNAIRYSPDGGAIAVTVRDCPTTGEVLISVRDHGLGVDPAYRPALFTRFGQAHAGTSRSGLGLGLYISKQITDLHGGTIAADFPPDGGSLFSVRLPRQAPPPGRDADAPERTPHDRAG